MKFTSSIVLFAAAALPMVASDDTCDGIDLYGDSLNNNPSHNYPLAECEGDCDASTQCACGLECYQFESVANSPPPGCCGEIFNHPSAGVYDYCACPTTGCDFSACQTDSDAGGDPHFKTWSGKWFDFHGECDLKLVHTPNLEGEMGNNLDLHARTTIRYGYSFIETTALRIGEDTLEVSSWGEYSLNGVLDAFTEGGSLRNAPVAKMGRYPVYHSVESKKRQQFDIVITPSSNITVYTHKDIVGVKVSHGTEFGRVSGLWGNVQGNLFARDHKTIMSDLNEYGQEWQVTDEEPMLFRNSRAPQYPAKCIMPNFDEKEARRLSEGITEEAAKIACDRLKEDQYAFHNCVYDVTATNDLDMADTGAM